MKDFFMVLGIIFFLLLFLAIILLITLATGPGGLGV